MANPKPHYEVPRHFLVEIDSLLSWVAHRGWKISSEEDRRLTVRLQNQARDILERGDSDVPARPMTHPFLRWWKAVGSADDPEICFVDNLAVAEKSWNGAVDAALECFVPDGNPEVAAEAIRLLRTIPHV